MAGSQTRPGREASPVATGYSMRSLRRLQNAGNWVRVPFHGIDHPSIRAASTACFNLRSAYISVVFRCRWPRTAPATSIPRRSLISPARRCRSWFGLQRSMSAASHARWMARRYEGVVYFSPADRPPFPLRWRLACDGHKGVFRASLRWALCSLTTSAGLKQ